VIKSPLQTPQSLHCPFVAPVHPAERVEEVVGLARSPDQHRSAELVLLQVPLHLLPELFALLLLALQHLSLFQVSVSLGEVVRLARFRLGFVLRQHVLHPRALLLALYLDLFRVKVRAYLPLQLVLSVLLVLQQRRFTVGNLIALPLRYSHKSFPLG